MIAGGADIGGLFPHHDMAAVPALPDLDLALGENLGRFHIVKQGAVTLLMVLFDGGYQTEPGGQLREALFLGGLGEARVHIRPLVVLRTVP